jgi:hypothetical protein
MPFTAIDVGHSRIVVPPAADEFPYTGNHTFDYSPGTTPLDRVDVNFVTGVDSPPNSWFFLTVVGAEALISNYEIYNDIGNSGPDGTIQGASTGLTDGYSNAHLGVTGYIMWGVSQNHVIPVYPAVAVSNIDKVVTDMAAGSTIPLHLRNPNFSPHPFVVWEDLIVVGVAITSITPAFSFFGGGDVSADFEYDNGPGENGTTDTVTYLSESDPTHGAFIRGTVAWDNAAIDPTVGGGWQHITTYKSSGTRDLCVAIYGRMGNLATNYPFTPVFPSATNFTIIVDAFYLVSVPVAAGPIWFFRNGAWHNAGVDPTYNVYMYRGGAWRQVKTGPTHNVYARLGGTWLPG